MMSSILQPQKVTRNLFSGRGDRIFLVGDSTNCHSDSENHLDNGLADVTCVAVFPNSVYVNKSEKVYHPMTVLLIAF